MNTHKNARPTPLPREEMALSVIEGRLSKSQAARICSARQPRSQRRSGIASELSSACGSPSAWRGNLTALSDYAIAHRWLNFSPLRFAKTFPDAP